MTTETDTKVKVTNEPTPDDDGRYDAAVVTSLREENARRRVEAKAGEDAFWELATETAALRDTLLAREVADATRDVLADPDDLLAAVDRSGLVGDDGRPDREKIAAEATALIEMKPHLKARTLASDIGQGARGETVTPAPTMFDALQRVRR